MLASGFVLEFLKGPTLALQDFYLLTGRAMRNVVRQPHYTDDIKLQMDSIGVGSIPIVLLTGFFSGAVMALQMGRALQQYGQTGRTGTVVSIILVRELGPVLTALMVAGRNASGIASELGMVGGWIIGKLLYDLDALQYWSQTWHALVWSDVVQGLLKPFVYSFVISLIGCFYGLRASGGTQGVGRATTQAMVAASVTILILNLFMGLIFVKYSGN